MSPDPLVAIAVLVQQVSGPRVGPTANAAGISAYRLHERVKNQPVVLDLVDKDGKLLGIFEEDRKGPLDVRSTLTWKERRLCLEMANGRVRLLDGEKTVVDAAMADARTPETAAAMATFKEHLSLMAAIQSDLAGIVR